jgi:hypothetical protein
VLHCSTSAVFHTRMDPPDPKEALALARRVSDPWFRCQALAWVARHASEELVSSIALGSFNSARQQGDGYKAVAVSAWPVRALIERNRTEVLPEWLSEMLRRARGIENPVIRLDSLLLLCQGAFPFPHSAIHEQPRPFFWARG